MSGTNIEPEQIRPELHQKIDRMDAEQLALLHRIVLKLELEQVTDELHQAFDAARAEGKFERLDEIICRVRTRRPYP